MESALFYDHFLPKQQNGVELQLWATWLLYEVLVDLTDAVAELLKQPFAALSLEMVYRSLYFFTSAFQRGAATDVVAYLAENAKQFGILKPKRAHPSAKFCNLHFSQRMLPYPPILPFRICSSSWLLR